MVLTGYDIVRDVEFSGRATSLAVADLFSVDPKVERRIDTTKVDQDVTPLPIRWKLEGCAVAADGVVVSRSLGRGVRVWILLVGIDRCSVPV